ncbi:MAG: hypothetical protein ACJ75J_07250, partial [Cytophagaceae bacterium]
NPSKISYHIRPHLTMKGCRELSIQTIDEQNLPGLKMEYGTMIVWQGKKILLADTKPGYGFKPSADIVIAGKDVFNDKSEALQYLDTKMLLFDSSNRKQKAAFTEISINS